MPSVVEVAKPDDFINPSKMFIGWVPTCGTVICRDVQSGPIFCDKIARYSAESKKRLGAICYFCEEHFPNNLREMISR